MQEKTPDNLPRVLRGELLTKAAELKAVTLIEKHLSHLPHPTCGPDKAPGVLRLVAFDHYSPGIGKVRKQIAEALVSLLTDNGLTIGQSRSKD